MIEAGLFLLMLMAVGGFALLQSLGLCGAADGEELMLWLDDGDELLLWLDNGDEMLLWSDKDESLKLDSSSVIVIELFFFSLLLLLFVGDMNVESNFCFLAGGSISTDLGCCCSSTWF